MNSPRVIALQYRIEHDQSVDYSRAEPVDHDEEDFSIRIEDNRVRFAMKVHVATVDSAKDAVESYIRSWELDAALRGQPGQFKLRFDRSEIRDCNPTTGEMYATKEFLAPSYSATVTRRSQAYPEPPAGVPLKRSDDVDLMFSLYEAFYDDREKITGIAYFCLTMLEKLAGGAGREGKSRKKLTSRRKKAAERFGIKGCVLNEVGYLSSEKGGPTEGRKADATENDLTPDERRFLLCKVKKFIRKVAKDAQSSGSNTRNGHL